MRQLLFLLLLFSAAICHAQEYTGKVVDETGNAVEGVTIQVKGSASGTVSNSKGEFGIKLVKLPATLVFSAVNFKSYETRITAKTNRSFRVVLLASSASLEEVVVTAYESGSSRSHVYAETAIAPSPGVAIPGDTRDSYTDYHSFPKSGRVRGVSTAKKKTSGIALEGMAAGMPPVHNGRKVYYTGDTAIESAGVAVRSGLLTAGEINDFKKWKMWEDFNEKEFKQYSEQWRLSTLNRYAVQLQNRSHKALVGVKVYLINQPMNDTVWTAVSDNTGKAELWAEVNGGEVSNYIISVEGKRENFKASGFANGMNNIRLDKDCGVSTKVQVSFVVDATGSMGDEIGYLKEELEDIIAKISEKHSTLDLNLSSVFYKDKGDDYVTREINFQEDILNVVNFIKLQQAGGGGDYPEAVNDALRKAIDELDWDDKARARILFLVLDAPPHNEARDEMLSLMQKAAAKGIRVVPIACSGTDKSTEFLMRTMALATNGTYLFLTDHSGIGGSHIEPTTDSYSVELLNVLLQRTIEQMIFVPGCEETKEKVDEPIDPRYVNTLKLKLYPNPTQGKLVIETDKEIKEMFVADFSGKLLKRIAVAKDQRRFNVDLTEYPSATYFIRYLTADGKQGAEKVILLH